jgi:hypothetical protein
VLPWCQAEPCRQIATFGESAAVTNGGEERGRVDDANAGDSRQPPRLPILARQCGKFVVIRLDPLVELDPLVAKVSQQCASARTDSRISGHEAFEATHQVDATFRQDNSTLEQHRTQLVDQRGSGID